MPHERVRCVAPTLIQEPGDGVRTIEDKRAELAAVPAEVVLSDEDVAEIRAIGDNTGCMALKGASPQFSGEPQPDRWPLDGELAQLAERWAIDPQGALAHAAAAWAPPRARQGAQAVGAVTAPAAPRPARAPPPRPRSRPPPARSWR